MKGWKMRRRTLASLVAGALIVGLSQIAAPAQAAGDDVVPDPLFRACLNNTAIHQPAANAISAAQLQALTGTINCAFGQRFGSDGIEGAQYLTGISSLLLSYRLPNPSNLSPLAGLTNLTRLDLDNGYITDLTPLSGLKTLQRLNLTGNLIKDVSPLAGLDGLSYLDLTSNLIMNMSSIANFDAVPFRWGFFDAQNQGTAVGFSQSPSALSMTVVAGTPTTLGLWGFHNLYEWVLLTGSATFSGNTVTVPSGGSAYV
jgi:hypothetical protein